MSASSPVKSIQAGLSFLSVIFSVVAIVNVNWVGTQTGDTGLFSFQQGSGEIKNLNCDSMMSQTQCGYLQSSQNASVISTIFCFLTFSWLVYQYSLFTPMNALVGFALSFLQFCFGITAVVVYSFFKEDYLDADDGVNVEYPVHNFAHYRYAFYFWIGVTSVAFVVSLMSGYELFRLTRSYAPLTKGIRDLENN